MTNRKKSKRRTTGTRLFYTAFTLCLTALGLGVWGVVNSTVDNGQIDSFTGAPQSEIDWDSIGIRDYSIVYDDYTEDRNVNINVSGIPDERVDEPDSVTQAESTTAQDISVLPYVGSFAMPLDSTIVKDYSNGEMVRSKTMGDWRIHNGIDFGDSRGASVVAVQDGTVTEIIEDELWGTIVIIDHGNGFVAKYCGLASDNVPAVGSAVEKHEIVGNLGDIPVESADGPHLHFETYINGMVDDPLKVLNRLS